MGFRIWNFGEKKRRIISLTGNRLVANISLESRERERERERERGKEDFKCRHVARKINNTLYQQRLLSASDSEVSRGHLRSFISLSCSLSLSLSLSSFFLGFIFSFFRFFVIVLEMEGKRSSFVDELFPQKEAALPAKSDILSSIFPQSSPGAGMNSTHYESTSRISRRKQGSDFRSSNGQNRISGASPHGNPSNRHNLPKKNNSPVVLCEIAEPCLMSSSIHYGGRDDFIPENSSLNSVCSYNYKKDKEDDFNNSDVATRGEWWQGSFYY